MAGYMLTQAKNYIVNRIDCIVSCIGGADCIVNRIHCVNYIVDRINCIVNRIDYIVKRIDGILLTVLRRRLYLLAYWLYCLTCVFVSLTLTSSRCSRRLKNISGIYLPVLKSGLKHEQNFDHQNRLLDVN